MITDLIRFRYQLHLSIGQDDLIYLCIARSDFPKRMCYGCLDGIEVLFMSTFTKSVYTHAQAWALNGEFAPILAKQMVSLLPPPLTRSNHLICIQQRIITQTIHSMTLSLDQKKRIRQKQIQVTTQKKQIFPSSNTTSQSSSPVVHYIIYPSSLCKCYDIPMKSFSLTDFHVRFGSLVGCIKTVGANSFLLCTLQKIQTFPKHKLLVVISFLYLSPCLYAVLCTSSVSPTAI